MVFAIPKREMNAECTLIFPYLYVRFDSHGGVGLYLKNGFRYRERNKKASICLNILTIV